MSVKIIQEPKLGDGRIVWILGAGFSKSLGGPLIADLLSPESQARLSSIPGLDTLFKSNHVRLAHWLYNFGTRYSRGLVPAASEAGSSFYWDRDGQSLWENAEEFLDSLDRAVRGGEASARWVHLRKVIETGAPKFFRNTVDVHPELLDISKLHAGAVRLFAAECAHFLVDAKTEEERWEPYRRWLSLLRPGDAVLTFNYDLVLEHLGLKPLLPGEEEKATAVRVLKLHGSLNWKRSGSKFERITGSEVDFICSAPAEQIGIATPGPSKALHTQELSGLWSLAQKALRAAHAIVVVGYSFPRTDSEARGWLVDSLASNRQTYLALHIVLGAPRTETVDRVTELMQLVFRRGGRREFDGKSDQEQRWDHLHGTVNRSSLYGEDLFSVADRQWLCVPYLRPLIEKGVPIADANLSG